MLEYERFLFVIHRRLEMITLSFFILLFVFVFIFIVMNQGRRDTILEPLFSGEEVTHEKSFLDATKRVQRMSYLLNLGRGELVLKINQRTGLYELDDTLFQESTALDVVMKHGILSELIEDRDVVYGLFINLRSTLSEQTRSIKKKFRTISLEKELVLSMYVVFIELLSDLNVLQDHLMRRGFTIHELRFESKSVKPLIEKMEHAIGIFRL